jgi:putative transposase
VRFRFVWDHVGEFSVEGMCRVLGVSRSGYYDWRRRDPSQRSQNDQRLLAVIKAIRNRKKDFRTYGSPRMHREVRKTGIACGRHQVARVMRENGIRAVQKRKFRPSTTDSNHKLPVAKNLLDRQFTVSRPNTVWAGDITYIRTRQGWLYLAVVLDLFSRTVVGWAVGRDLSRHLPIRALQMALGRRTPEPGALFHSDRGSQYASQDYQDLLAAGGLICSMSRKGECYDNAVAESFFHTLKVERVYQQDYPNHREATADLFEYIEIFYNRQRRHSHLGQVSPAVFEKSWEGVVKAA